MNEIEKMYENAGIKTEKPYRNGHIIKDSEIQTGEKGVVVYNFTAEKQLFLIQWLAKTRPIHITLLLDKWTIEGIVRYGIKYDTFEDALSGYINQIWKDLTDTEKEQIKEILK